MSYIKKPVMQMRLERDVNSCLKMGTKDPEMLWEDERKAKAIISTKVNNNYLRAQQYLNG